MTTILFLDDAGFEDLEQDLLSDLDKAVRSFSENTDHRAIVTSMYEHRR
jgi:hypothetical protein